MERDLPTLGVGLGFREPFLAELFRHRDGVDFLEITADHYFDAPEEKRAELDLLAAHFPIIPHGLDLSLGSAEGIDEAYLDAMADLVARLDPPWWSEHIAYTRAGGVSIGHLAPLPWTREAVDVVVRNVERVRRRIRPRSSWRTSRRRWSSRAPRWTRPGSSRPCWTGPGAACSAT